MDYFIGITLLVFSAIGFTIGWNLNDVGKWESCCLWSALSKILGVTLIGLLAGFSLIGIVCTIIL